MFAHPIAEPLALSALLWLLICAVWLGTVDAASHVDIVQAKLRRLRIWLLFALGEMAVVLVDSSLLGVAAAVALAILAAAEIAAASEKHAWAFGGLALALGITAVEPAAVAIAAAAAGAAILAMPYRPTALRSSFVALACGSYAGLTPCAVYAARAEAGLLGALLLGLTLSHLVDIAAGFGGRGGKLKPFGRLTPNKTIRGLCAGLGAALLCAPVMYVLVRGRSIGLLPFAVAAGIWSATTLGDLVGSKAKRIFGVKDFGATLGPHGGMMDRLDSFAPVTVLCCTLSQLH